MKAPEAAAPPRTPPAAAPAEGQPCLNCGHAPVAAFCAACGQRTFRSRLTLPRLVRQGVADAFNVDRGLLHTVIALSTRPGEAVRDYLRGRTLPYTNPIKYLLVFVALATFATLNSGLLDPRLLASAGGDPQASALTGVLSELMARYFNLLLVFAVPFLTVFSWLLFRRAGLNFAEHVIFNVYVYGHQSFLFLVLLPFLYLVDREVLGFTALYLAAITVYYVWACVLFFRVGVVRGAVLALAVTLLANLSYYAAVALAGWLYLTASGSF